MAFSPGVMQPVEVHGKPRIFISHGIGDQMMPIDVTSRHVGSGLSRTVTVRLKADPTS